MAFERKKEEEEDKYKNNEHSNFEKALLYTLQPLYFQVSQRLRPHD